VPSSLEVGEVIGACMIIGVYLTMHGMVLSGMPLVRGWPPTCLGRQGGPSRRFNDGMSLFLR
jgi:hypothetical protein